MKRKFFSVMMAACTAVFSFSGLTGCSGGGGEENPTYGYVSLKDFATMHKGFYIGGATMTIEVIPKEYVRLETPGMEGVAPKDIPHRASGFIVMKGILRVGAAEIPASFTYNVEWPEDSEEPVPGDGSIKPTDGEISSDLTTGTYSQTGTYLLVSFTRAGASFSSQEQANLNSNVPVSNANLLTAMGVATKNAEVSAAIRIAIQSKGTCDMATKYIVYANGSQVGPYDAMTKSMSCFPCAAQ